MTFDNSNSSTVHPSRLISAADAILAAANSPGAGTVRLPPDPAASATLGYTSHELEEAALFLARLGMVELVKRAGPSRGAR
jgi:hypothetical protein